MLNTRTFAAPLIHTRDFFPPARQAPPCSAARIPTVSGSKTCRNIAPPPQYSPDLSPPDYLLFPKVKLNPKGARFDTTEEAQKAVTDQLNKIPSEDFSNAMKKL